MGMLDDQVAGKMAILRVQIHKGAETGPGNAKIFDEIKAVFPNGKPLPGDIAMYIPDRIEPFKNRLPSKPSHAQQYNRKNADNHHPPAMS